MKAYLQPSNRAETGKYMEMPGNAVDMPAWWKEKLARFTPWHRRGNLAGLHRPLVGFKNLLLLIVLNYAVSSVLQAQSPGSPTPLLDGINWHQKSPFNALSPNWPYYIQGQYVTTKGSPGCGAIAVAMILKKHQRPVEPSDIVIDYDIHHNGANLQNVYQNIYADLTNRIYDYAQFPGDPDRNIPNPALSEFIFDVGAAIYTEWNENGKPAGEGLSYLEDIKTAVVETFKYKNSAVIIDRWYWNIPGYKKDQLLQIIRAEIDLGRPIIMYAKDEFSGSAHIMVIDGYDAGSNEVHINVGWGSAYNKYYDLDDITTGNYKWSRNQRFLVGIEPLTANNPSPSARIQNHSNVSASQQRVNMVCPNLLSPYPGQRNASNSIELIWEEVAGADRYLVDIEALGAGIVYYDSVYSYASNIYFEGPELLPANDSISVTISPVDYQGNVLTCTPFLFYTDTLQCDLVLQTITPQCLSDTSYEVVVEFTGLNGHTYDLWAEDGIGVVTSLNSISPGTHILGPIPIADNVAIVIEDEADPYDCNDAEMATAPNCTDCPNISWTLASTSCDTNGYDVMVSLEVEGAGLVDLYTGNPNINTHDNVGSGEYTFHDIPNGEGVVIIAEDISDPYNCNHIEYLFPPTCMFNDSTAKITRIEYYIDSDPGYGQGTEIPITPGFGVNVNYSIDLSGLSPGVHTLYIRSQNENGQWGFTQKKTFYVSPSPPGSPALLADMEYYIDTDPGYGAGTPLTLADPNDSDALYSIDLSGVAPGVHTFYVRARNENGQWGFTQKKVFYVSPTPVGGSPALLADMEYYIDTDPGYGAGTPLTLADPNDSDALYSIDLSGVAPGVHTFYVRARNENGQWGFTQKKVFYVSPTPVGGSPALLADMEYYIDTDPGYGAGTPLTLAGPNDSDALYSIDLSGVAPGVHTLYLRARNELGQWGFTQKKLFYLSPAGSGAPSLLTDMEYYIDTDPGFGNATPLTLADPYDSDALYSIDLGGLPEGMHTFYVRAKNDRGQWGFTQVKAFEINNASLAVLADTLTTAFTSCNGSANLLLQLNNDGIGDVSWSATNLPSWLSLDIASGTILPGDTADVTLTIHAAGLGNGSYAHHLEVTSNSISSPDTVLVAFTLDGPAVKTVAPASLAFGQVAPGSSSNLSVNIQNTGCDTIRVSGITSTDPAFVPAFVSVDVPPYQAVEVDVIFSPAVTSPYSGHLVLTTDYGDDVIPMSGIGCLDSPVTEFFEEACTPAAVGVDTLFLANQEGCDSLVITRTSLHTAVSNDSIVAYYPFQGGPGDQSGWGRHATLNGATLAADRFGNAGNAYNFDGNDRGNLPTAAFSGLTHGAFSAWAYFNNNNFGTIIDKTTTYLKNYFQLAVMPNNAKLRIYIDTPYNGGPTAANFFSNQTIMSGRWYHFVITWDGVMVKMYINGTLDNQVASAADIDDNTVPVLLGVVDNNTLWLNGKLDDILIFERSLSAEEVYQLYLENRTLGPNPIASDTLVDFGTAIPGETRLDTVYLTNTSCDTLIIDAISNGNASFSAGQSQLSIPPYGSAPVEVSFTPAAFGQLLDTLHFAGPSADASVVLSGTAAVNSILVAIPGTLTAELSDCNGAANLLLRLTSDGNDSISWSAAMLPAWIGLDTESGTIPPGDTVDVNLTISASGLSNGSYSHSLVLQSNSISSPDTVEVAFTLDGPAVLSVAPDALAFGQVDPGSSVVLPLSIQNTGCDTLRVSSIMSTDAAFVPGLTSLEVLPYQSAAADITFSPTATAGYSGELLLQTDYGNSSIPLNGVGCLDSPVTELYAITCLPAEAGPDTLFLINQEGCDSLVITYYYLPGYVDLTDPDLVAYYPFDGNAMDASNNGRHAQLNGPAATIDRFGNPNSALDFDGGADHVALPASDLLGNKPEWTFNAFVYLRDSTRRHTLYGEYNNVYHTRNYIIYSPDTSGIAYDNWPPYAGDVEQAPLPLLEWHFVSVVRESDTIRIYIDGVLRDERPREPYTGNAITVAAIGARLGMPGEVFLPGTWSLDGKIDEVAIYQRALTIGEIQQLYLQQAQPAEERFTVSDTLLDFGNVTVGQSDTLSLYLTNTTCDTLDLSAILTGNAAFSAMPIQLSLPPYASGQVEVTFQPDAPSFYLGQLEVQSAMDTIQVELRGSGCILPPSLTYSGTTTLCSGDSLRLSTSQGDAITWITGETADTITVFEPGDYYAIYSNQNGCLAYTDTVTVTLLPDAAIVVNGATTLCESDQTQLQAVNADSYSWSTGESTETITVQPLASEWYYLTATNSQGCSYVDSVRIDVIPATAPGPVSNMLPADGSVDQPTAVTFSWLPGGFSSTYDLYLWPDTESKPPAPTYANLNQILISRSGLIQGNTYFWQVHAKNSCLETPGPVQSFTVASLPDLVVQNVQVPASAFSGQSITVSWEVHNQGAGNTGSQSWLDNVGLSEDNYNHTGGVDPLVASQVNVTALNSGESYVNTATFDLPQGISGSYFIFIQADAYRDVPETDDQNNSNPFGAYFPVTLSPPPDLQPTTFITANNAFSGQYIPVNYTVENQGTGTTIVSGWADEIYLSAEQEFNENAVLKRSINHSGLLLPGESYTVNDSIQLPANVQGTYYAFVQTDALNAVYEFVLEDNNVRASTPIQVFLTPPADLVIDSIGIIPDTVHNHQAIPFSWVVKNAGANTTNANAWYDQLSWSALDTFNIDSIKTLADTYHNGTLGIGESYQVNTSRRIPHNINGDHYLYLRTDRRNDLFEFSEDNNRSAAIPIHVLSPDLSPDSLSHNTAAVSGQAMIVNYQVKNNGPGHLLERGVGNVFWISTHPAFDPDSVVQVGSASFTADIQSGAYRQQQAVIQLPEGISGQYYLYIKTDAGNGIFENGMEANNILQSDSVIQVALQAYADLAPASIQLPDTAYAGQSLSYAYTVNNLGNAGLDGETWADKAFLSRADTLGPGAWSIGAFNMSETVPAGGSYSAMRQYNIPAGLAEGQYYLYIQSDYNDNIFEYGADSNNVFRSDPFYVAGYPSSDLEVLSASITPAAPTSGQAVVFNWQAANSGTAATIGNPWKDAVFLSADDQWDTGDLLLGTANRQSPLAVGSSYTAQLNYALPNDSIGDYYFIVVADRNFQTNDSDTLNNYFVIGSGGGAGPITIPLTPPPDLQVTAFTAPNQGVAGQPAEVIWTVTNQGTGPAGASEWTDRFYLATSPAGGGPILATARHVGGLPAGQSYTDTITFDLPLNAAGNYYLAVITDANNQVYEHDQEGNNRAVSLLSVEQPPPADLRVSGISPGSDTIVIGGELSLSWQTENIGFNPAQGAMTEGVYLSADSLWDVGDVLVKTLSGGVFIPPLGSISRSLAAPVSRAAYGWNYVILRTDLRNNFAEDDETNNTTVGPPVFVDVKDLPLYVLTPDTLSNEEELYYKVAIPDSLAGESLVITLTGDTLLGYNEAYVSYGQLPTRYNAQYQHQEALMGRQEVVVPRLSGGQYYNLSQGRVLGGDEQEVSLLAEIQPFEVKRVVADRGGNTGNITVKISGARFEENMFVRLSNPDSAVELQAYEVVYVDPTTIYATFSLDAGAYLGYNQPIGVDTGYYDVKLIKTNGDVAVLPDGFLVEAGSSPNVKVNVIYPDRTRTFRTAPITIEYENVGGMDIPVPRYLLVSLGNLPVGENESTIIQAVRNNDWQGYREVQLELRDPGRPDSDILKAGARGVLTVYTFINRAGRYDFKLIDLD